MKSARAITTCLVPPTMVRSQSATSPITTSLSCTSMVPRKDAVVASEATVAVDLEPTSTRLVQVTSRPREDLKDLSSWWTITLVVAMASSNSRDVTTLTSTSLLSMLAIATTNFD